MFRTTNQQIHIMLRSKDKNNKGAITDHKRNSDCCWDDVVMHYPGYELPWLCTTLVTNYLGYALPWLRTTLVTNYTGYALPWLRTMLREQNHQ